MISDEIQAIIETTAQYNRAINAIAILQRVKMELDKTDADIQEIKDSGAIDMLPNELKTALNDGWVIVKNARASIENNPDLSTLLGV